MTRASWLVVLLVLVATFALPSAAAQALSDCTGSPIGEGIYVSGCRAYAMAWVGFAVDTVFCLYNTAPAHWVSLTGEPACVSVAVT